MFKCSRIMFQCEGIRKWEIAVNCINPKVRDDFAWNQKQYTVNSLMIFTPSLCFKYNARIDTAV